MILATDLDNTMIFSSRKVAGKEDSVRCVEYYNGKPTTFMTDEAFNMLCFLQKKIVVIPTTTRSIAQFQRVEIFNSTEYSIVDNGGTILHFGAVQSDWEAHINKILMKYDFEKAFKIFEGLPSLTLAPRLVDQKFLFAKSDDTAMSQEYLRNKLDPKDWQISFQGQKVYAIPSEITKGNALKFICENFLSHDTPVIAAGDSNLDMSMLDYSDYGIIPCDSNLSALNIDGYIKAGEGIYAAEAILKLVIDLFHQKIA